MSNTNTKKQELEFQEWANVENIEWTEDDRYLYLRVDKTLPGVPSKTSGITNTIAKTGFPQWLKRDLLVGLTVGVRPPK